MFANLMLDAGGCICGWNPRAERIFRIPAPGAAKRHFSALLRLPDGADEGARLLDAARRYGSLDYAGIGERGDGTAFPAQVLIAPIAENAVAQGYSIVIVDTTERAEAERRRRDDNARLVNILQSAMDAIVTIDEDQKIVLFNAAAEQVFACPAAQAIGTSLERFVPERYRAAHRAHVERFAATGTTTRRMGDRMVLTGLRTDGAEFPIEASISQVDVAGRKLFTVILRDITERQRAADELEQSHDELRRLYAEMHEVREAERTRIARELHDELAQWLTALKMDVAWLAARIDPAQGALTGRLKKMSAAVDTTVAAVRRIAADLRPVMLDDLGLVPSLEHLLQEFSRRTGATVSLAGDARSVVFREPLVSAVYRMVQEALTNVARHAQASSVSLDVRAEGGHLLLRVRDDGRGIRPGDLEARRSYGLLGIRERARTLGGMARIYSPQEGGTIVDIDIPLGQYIDTGESKRS